MVKKKIEIIDNSSVEINDHRASNIKRAIDFQHALFRNYMTQENWEDELLWTMNPMMVLDFILLPDVLILLLK